MMCQIAVHEGLSLNRLLRGSGVPASIVDDPTMLATPRAELHVIRNLVDAYGDSDGLGVRIGSQFHLSVYRDAAFAASSCSNLGELLAMARKFSHMTFWLLDIRFKLQAWEPSIVLQDDHIPADLRRFVIERDVSGMLATGRGLFPNRLPLSRLEWTLPTSVNDSVYAQYLQISPIPSAVKNRFVLQPKDLRVALPLANTLVRTYWERKFPQSDKNLQVQTSSTADIVQNILTHTHVLTTSMEDVAHQLNMTSRHLRRRLSAEGTSFRNELLRRRKQLAVQLLYDPSVSISEISTQLGFSEISSFTHAFKRWYGLSPRIWREQNANV